MPPATQDATASGARAAFGSLLQHSAVITDLVLFSRVEFGTRASVRSEGAATCPVVCAVDGDLARKFMPHYREGDIVLVNGFDEPRPLTVAANTPWLGRFRVCAVRAVDDARLAVGQSQIKGTFARCNSSLAYQLPGRRTN